MHCVLQVEEGYAGPRIAAGRATGHARPAACPSWRIRVE
ncbi:hypothetical protein L810_8142 [Burkholderia sp. AU4i]|nr:hypothetical protein L810_8142 [Burkholderia sp. AU4i]